MNNAIFFYLYNLAHQSVFFDSIVVFTAVWLGNLLIVGAVLFLFLHHDPGIAPHTVASLKRKTKEIAIVFIAAIVAWGASMLLKLLFGTPRPFAAFPAVHSLFSESGYGFPSGHATFFSALAAALYVSHARLGIAFGFCAFLIGIARIIAGVHFPLDILGGFILGPLIVAVLYHSIVPGIRRIFKI